MMQQPIVDLPTQSAAPNETKQEAKDLTGPQV